MRILLVEDDDSIRDVLKLILEVEAPIPDIVVEAASNGEEAIEKFKATRPDLVLLDLSLPTLSGFETFKHIQRLDDHSEVPVIAVTAHSVKDFETQARELGFAGYVTKPIDFEESLFPLMKKLLVDRHREEPHAA